MGAAAGDAAGFEIGVGRYSVSLSADGKTVAVGAPYHTNKGARAVFEL